MITHSCTGLRYDQHWNNIFSSYTCLYSDSSTNNRRKNCNGERAIQSIALADFIYSGSHSCYVPQSTAKNQACQTRKFILFASAFNDQSHTCSYTSAQETDDGAGNNLFGKSFVNIFILFRYRRCCIFNRNRLYIGKIVIRINKNQIV